jgi:hypothetical protein
LTTALVEKPDAIFEAQAVNELLGLYLEQIDDTEIENSIAGNITGDDCIPQLVEPELKAIATLRGDASSISCAVMWTTKFAIEATAVAMSKPPREAVQQISELLAELKKHLSVVD